MRLDVVLLSDIFQNFRHQSFKNYGLDPVFFVSAPGLSWQACLLITQQSLEIIKDTEMSSFINTAFIGGVSVARNPRLSAQFDGDEQTHHLLLVDANNMYGYAMEQPLPFGGFKWLSDSEVKNLKVEDIMEVDEDSEYGYIYEVDLEYPQNLHHEHDQYPCAPEHYIVDEEELSPYQREMAADYHLKIQTKKLCLTLHDKKNYKLHIKNLQQYISLGLKLKRVHRVLRFKQSCWLNKYIKLNTKLRQAATCKADESLPKLMNNSVFGKTCEDPYKYKQVKIILGAENVAKMQRLQNKPTFSHVTLFSEDCALATMRNQTVVLDKPRYVGASILFISKVIMYDFHYRFILPNFPGNTFF